VTDSSHLDRREFLLGAGGLAAFAYLGGPVWVLPRVAADGVSRNPVVTNIYTADPDAFVLDGRFYLDTDRDEAPLGANDFVMREWHLYSSADMVHWTDHGVRMNLATFAWANRNAWAAQMIHRDGKFFWYVPVQKAAGNSMSIGVAVADSVLGPFTDALGRPLIDNTVASGGLGNALTVKLTQVAALLRAGRRPDALTALAAFTALVESERGRLLTDAQATDLAGSAALIGSHIQASL
jgi:hypothetical protein